VNMQPKNSKLRDRACRIIMQAAGVSYETAAQLLDAAGGHIRTAILTARQTGASGNPQNNL